MFGHMTTARRIEAAKVKTERVVDRLLYLLALHENNAIIVYSDTLSSQVRYAHAADAFKVFRVGLFEYEIVRLYALWDAAKDDKKNFPTEESIPTIIELIDLPEAIEALVEETRGQQRSKEKLAHKQARRAGRELRKAIKDVRKILKSSIFRSAKNVRHKHLAHSLSETKLEKVGDVAPMKYGNET